MAFVFVEKSRLDRRRHPLVVKPGKKIINECVYRYTAWWSFGSHSISSEPRLSRMHTARFYNLFERRSGR